MSTAAAAGHIGAGSVVEWHDDEGDVSVPVQAYLVYPDVHVGRIMTGVVVVPDCAGFSTTYVRTFADNLAEQGYKVIVLELSVTTATADEWTNSGTFRKWRDSAVAAEATTVRRALRCRDLLKHTYEVQRVGVLGLGYGAEVAIRLANSFDAVALLSPTALPAPSPSIPTLLVAGDRNEYIDSSKIKAFVESFPSSPHAVRVRVVPGQRHGFALSRIADEDAATLAIADILDWFIMHLHRFRTALCTSDGDPWWPQGKNGPFYNVGLGRWQAQRASWLTVTRPRPPKPEPVALELLLEGLTSMKRTYDLPHPMALADLVGIYIDIWDINQ
ncbi:hypothetical protein H310_03160 [Aphanomyces invadans]|uniref:Dienelactone hydrolase domain-containing protein n=1 Tax=Aphanomyces invadans TaxID=157072 RepID=A0A024ULN5_9STRA|nr:hypothetical protein H310_03160 [Aphanomyces invadans]ETW07090.1 hypothetical protein H310_03160 [Aphanomyces invadans]|eukprot:XP_008865165.1 hypothetical protein H310_03160 [Aphanomyces invadans]